MNNEKKTNRKTFLSFEQALQKAEKTEEEFLRLYNLSQEERDKLFREMESTGKGYDWYIHVLIAYYNTYPEKKRT